MFGSISNLVGDKAREGVDCRQLIVGDQHEDEEEFFLDREEIFIYGFAINSLALMLLVAWRFLVVRRGS